MKKTLLTLAIALAGFATMNAQKGYYMSLSGGPTYAANEKPLSTSQGSLSGSYGEGLQAQLRGGYYFNDKFGVELGVGYLHGDEQQVRNDYLKITGKARAFGAALTGIYNFSENIYVKAGVLTKIGGKSLNAGSLDTSIPARAINPAAPATATVPLHVEFERDGKAKMPVGFIAAFGVRHKIADNWGIFVEMEYQGIDVTPDKSTLTSYSATLAGNPVERDQLLQTATALLGSGALKVKPEDLLSISDEFTYGKENDIANFKRKEFDVPYSSFGFSFGFTYFF